MAVKKGYKQTEIGVIPMDWTVVSLENHAQVRTGIAKNSSKRFSEPVRVHYLRVANVQDGYVDLTEMSEIDVERADLRRYLVLEGDVLMNEGGDRDKLGRACIWRGQFDPCVHQNHVFVVRCYSKLHPLFLSSWTQSLEARNFFINAGSQTTNLASINKTAISKLPIPLPPTLAEQEAIAGALSDADAWIESLEQLIAKKRQIKQGAMQELLTGKRRLPGFSAKWETKRLGDHCQFLRNGTNSRAELTVEGSLKYLHYGDIHSCNRVYMYSESLPSLPRKKANTLDRLQDGDLVLADASEDKIGISKSVEIVGTDGFELVAGLHTIAVRFSEGMFAPRFAGYLQHCPDFNSHLRKLAAGTKVYATNRRHVSSAEVCIPPLNEQTAIATLLSDMDTEIYSLESKLAKAREIKQGMMQELLTGRIRLV